MMNRTILKYCIIGQLLFLTFYNCEELTYTYDKTDPIISGAPSVTEVTDTNAVIVFETDEPCYSELYFDITTEFDTFAVDSEYRQLHMINLRNLLPKMTYYYQLKVWDFADNGPVESDINTFTTLENEFSYLREAWEKYADGQFTEALNLINEALSLNDYDPEIIISYGFFLLQTDSFDAARDAIESAYRLSPYMPLVLCGKALLAQADGLPEDVIHYCNIILNRESDWEYRYNSSINTNLVRLFLAEAYVQTNQSEKSQMMLDLVWPDNGLDPNLSASWSVNGQSYNEYTLALLAAIQYAVSQL